MGSGVSRKKKCKEDVEKEENSSAQNETVVSNGEKSKNDNHDRPKKENNVRRPKTDDATNLAASVNAERLVHIGREYTDQHPGILKNNAPKKFYYYPRKHDDSGTARETMFVTSSQFPYSKAKAVIVKPQSQTQYYGYPRDQHVDTQQNRENHHTRSYNIVNDRRWSNSSNVVPTIDYNAARVILPRTVAELRRSSIPDQYERPNVYPTDCVLPHRTVAELRRSNNTEMYDRPSAVVNPDNVLPHRTVAELRRASLPNQYERYMGMELGRRRPPTPALNTWCPPRRTNDYLVASSLLGAERNRDRRMNN